MVWFLGLFLIGGTVAMAAKKEVYIQFLIIPALMGAFGFFIMKQLVFDLVDELWDDGDALVVKNKGREERIALKNIINVSHSSFTNPPRITLTLREPCAFGRDITFSPPTKLLPFARHPIASELIERIDATRRRG
jgi:hypothetical protein